MITTSTLSWTAGSWIVERRSERWRRQSVVRAGQALVAVSCAGFIPIALGAPVLLSVPVWMVAGLGMGLAYPTYSLLTLSAAGANDMGATSSAKSLMEFLGAATGAGLIGAIVAAGDAGDWLGGAVAAGFTIMAIASAFGVPLSQRLLSGAPPAALGEPGTGLAAAS